MHVTPLQDPRREADVTARWRILRTAYAHRRGTVVRSMISTVRTGVAACACYNFRRTVALRSSCEQLSLRWFSLTVFAGTTRETRRGAACNVRSRERMLYEDRIGREWRRVRLEKRPDQCRNFVKRVFLNRTCLFFRFQRWCNYDDVMMILFHAGIAVILFSPLHYKTKYIAVLGSAWSTTW